MPWDVNHIHLIAYEAAGSKSPKVTGMIVTIFKPGVKKLVVITPLAPRVPAALAFDSNALYENAFAAEGAHWPLFTDADEYKLIMVGLPDRHASPSRRPAVAAS